MISQSVSQSAIVKHGQGFGSTWSIVRHQRHERDSWCCDVENANKQAILDMSRIELFGQIGTRDVQRIGVRQPVVDRAEWPSSRDAEEGLELNNT
jgi:hypothetical protein